MTTKIPSSDQRATASSHAKQEFTPMGCVSLSDAVAEVGKHLLGDDWIGDEIFAPALNIGGKWDRDTATAIRLRQFALLEEQEGVMAVMFWKQQIAEDLDPEPLPELSKDNLADVEKALAKKWEGEKEARNRLESATAWLGQRLYGTPPDYGDAVASYIPSWYGKLWRLSVGFWNKHSVQEVLFTKVEYNPADYGEIPPLNSRSFKGRVVILQEALREAITRDRPINQTDSGGRPTLKIEIEDAYKEIRDIGDINYDAPIIRLYDQIRKKVREYKGDQNLEKGLQKEAILKVIRPLFKADKNKRSASP